MMNRKACRLLVLSVALLCSPTEALRMSMNRKIHTNRSQSHTTTTIRGRLGHLRPRLWGAAVAVEESSPTSLQAAMKFKNFEEMLRTFGHSLVVVSFSNDLCGPCRLMKKEMSRVSTETAAGGNVKMFSVDTDKFPKLGTRFDISILPTLVIFKEGQVQDKLEGLQTADVVMEHLRKLL